MDLVFAIGAIAAAIGAIAIVYEGETRARFAAARTGLYAAAAAAVAIAYVVMAAGAGIVASEGGLFHAPRHIAWVVAAPAILVALALAAFTHGRANVGLLVALAVASAAAFVALGLAALTAGVPHWVWFATSAALFVVAAGIVRVPLREVADEGSPQGRETFATLAGATTGVAAFYPVLFLLGPQGVAVWGVATANVLFMILDVAFTVGIGLLGVRSARRLVAVDEPVGIRPEPAAERPATDWWSRPAPARPKRPDAWRKRPAPTAANALRRRQRPPAGGVVAFAQSGASGELGEARRFAAVREEAERARKRWLAALRRHRTAIGDAGRGAAATPMRHSGPARPPARLAVDGRLYALAGTAEAASAFLPRDGSPAAVVFAGHRYVRIGAPEERETESVRPNGAAAAPDRPEATRGAEPAAHPLSNRDRRPEPSLRSEAPLRSKPARRTALRRRRKAKPARVLSLADLPLDRVDPVAAVPVAIVTGVLLYVSWPRRR